MMMLEWRFIFLRQGHICIPIHLYGENVEKPLSQNLLKTNGCTLQYMIKVVRLFSYNQNFVICPWAIYIYKIVKSLNIFFSETTWPGVVGWCEGVMYLMSPGRPADIGLQLGKACYPCSR